MGGRANEVDRALPWLESTSANGDRSTADWSGRTIPRPKGTYTDRGGLSSGEARLTQPGALPAWVSRLSVIAASARTRLSDLGTSARLRGCASVGPSTKALGRVWVHGKGKVHIADGVILDGRAAPIELHAHPSAVIRIGSGARVEGGASLEAVSRIEIGRGVRLGAYCKILDNHFHSVGRERHRPPPSRPIVVEEGASVGARAILLPGAHIGSGAVVPADAVISRRFGAVMSAADQPVAAGGIGAVTGPAAVRAMPFLPGRFWFGKLRGQIDVMRAAWYLRGCERGPRVRATGPVRVAPDGSVRIGARTVFVGGMIPSRIECEPGASIEIGSSTVFNYGVTLAASESIRIGSRTMFGSLVRVCDRGEAGSQPVVIGDDVWVAHGATIGPGVTVGSGSVIAAGSVVTSDVPPESLAIGNPARSMSLSLRANDPAPGASQGGLQEVPG